MKFFSRELRDTDFIGMSYEQICNFKALTAEAKERRVAKLIDLLNDTEIFNDVIYYGWRIGEEHKAIRPIDDTMFLSKEIFNRFNKSVESIEIILELEDEFSIEIDDEIIENTFNEFRKLTSIPVFAFVATMAAMTV